VTPLGTLTLLSGLWLDGNRISDISPLGTLKNLEALDARDQEIELEELTLQGTSPQSRIQTAGRAGATVRIELARGINGDHVDAELLDPSHGQTTDGIATWTGVTASGTYSVSFTHDAGMPNELAGAADGINFSGTITQQVTITTEEPDDGSGDNNQGGTDPSDPGDGNENGSTNPGNPGDGNNSSGTGTDNNGQGSTPNPTPGTSGNSSGGSGSNTGSTGDNTTTGTSASGRYSTTPGTTATLPATLPAHLAQTGSTTTALLIITLAATLLGAGAYSHRLRRRN
jgi:LPXTG-motif cell wall-anchored protein